MIKFLFKGLLRDRSRSIFPVLVVMAGVTLTVIAHCWLKGYESNILQSSAIFDTGHLKVMSQAYYAEADQVPNDLALMGIDSLLLDLQVDFPGLIWAPRIRFGGLLDVPGPDGETKDQGPVFGLAIQLTDPKSVDVKVLNLEKALVSGRLPQKSREILISDEFAKKLKLGLNQTATLISSTAFSGMSINNFTVVGTIRFGISVMDRGAIIADIQDIQFALDLQNSAGEILGFFPDNTYYKDEAAGMAARFNTKYQQPEDNFSPIMVTLREQAGLAEMLEIIESFSGILIAIFVFVMSLVLWNAGLMGSLRRYGEFGVRLAIGESKSHVYLTLLLESILIGFIGSLLGTLLGVAVGYYLQIKGIDISYMMKNASMVISNVLRGRVTPFTWLIGFIPGLLAMLIGTAISGIGIYKRQTSQLFKELEV